MSKLNYGKLGKYINSTFLEKTNFDEFLSQDVIDFINERLNMGDLVTLHYDWIHFEYIRNQTKLEFVKNDEWYTIINKNNIETILVHKDKNNKIQDMLTVDKNGCTVVEGDKFKIHITEAETCL